MFVKTIIQTSQYYDSVSLMLVARELSALPGVQDAAVVMATEANKSILRESGLLTEQIEQASANDLVIAVSTEDDLQAEGALQKAQALLTQKTSSTTSEFQPKSMHGAVASHPEANLAVISVAGRYAADETWKALRRGLHVLLFSDNVSLHDEIALKRYAREHSLFLMGPGAGTAILNGVALGFANVVPAGPVGIVSAAGTGLQEVSTLLDRLGVGITQGIGTGGRDLKREVGGIMMLEAIHALQQDKNTEVIVLISKPPDPAVAEVILEQVAVSDKPTVVCFMGQDVDSGSQISAKTLQEAAWLAAQASGINIGSVDALLEAENGRLSEQAEQLKEKLAPEQLYLRGLFSGGTLCYEAQVIWRDLLRDPVYCNAPLPGGLPMPDTARSQGHTAIDLGEEQFTIGRPHPMIDNDLRIRRLLQEAEDPQVGVILLDVVLGYGAHPDPTAELVPAIRQAHELVRQTGRELIVITNVTGTEQDPQVRSQQVKTLEGADVIVCESNATAARLAGLTLQILEVSR
jgi:succinyl-CoA synthetase alpha subunit